MNAKDLADLAIEYINYCYDRYKSKEMASHMADSLVGFAKWLVEVKTGELKNDERS